MVSIKPARALVDEDIHTKTAEKRGENLSPNTAPTESLHDSPGAAGSRQALRLAPASNSYVLSSQKLAMDGNNETVTNLSNIRPFMLHTSAVSACELKGLAKMQH